MAKESKNTKVKAKGSSQAARYKQAQRAKAARPKVGRPTAVSQHPELDDYVTMYGWYVEEGLSLKQIGAKLEVSHNTVRTALLKHAIVLRGRGTGGDRKDYGPRTRRLEIPAGYTCKCGEAHAWYQPPNKNVITCNECGRKYEMVETGEGIFVEPLLLANGREWSTVEDTTLDSEELKALERDEATGTRFVDPSTRQGKRPDWHTKIRGAGAK